MNNRKQNTIYFFWMLLITGLSFGACSDDEKTDAYLEASTDLINLDYQGLWEGSNENASFELGANVSWKVTSVNEWITLNHVEGKRGRTTIFITAEENLTGEDREGLIIIEGNGLYQFIDIYQTLKSEELTVRPTSITVTKSGKLESGEQASIDIETNSNWEITEYDSWIKPDKMTGKAGYTAVNLDIEQNKTGEVRTGKFIVVSGSKKTEVTVTQNLEGLKVSPRVIEVNIEGEIEGEDAVKFDIDAAESWTIENSATSWITPSATNGNAGNTTITLSISKNGTGAVRTGSLKVITTSGLEDEVIVTQTLRTPATILYYEPFDWCTNDINKPGSAAIQDPVGTNGKQGTTFNLFDKKYTGAKEAFDAAGLTCSNSETSIYIALGYLKFGKTKVQTGITLPAITSLQTATDAVMTFDVSTCCTGSLVPDKTKITVEITGEGSLSRNEIVKKIDNIDTSDGYKWNERTVNLYGINTNTRITIRSTQQGMTDAGADQFRWFVDNIKIIQPSN